MPPCCCAPRRGRRTRWSRCATPTTVVRSPRWASPATGGGPLQILADAIAATHQELTRWPPTGRTKANEG